MIPTPRDLIAGALLLGCALLSTASPAFEIGESFGKVQVSTTEQNQQICQTAPEARALLILADGGLIRLGANSEFRSNAKTMPASLLNGTALFDFSHHRGALTLEHGGKHLTIRDGVGLVRLSDAQDKQESVLLISGLAQKTSVTIDGRGQRLKSGELLVLNSKGRVVVGYFNLESIVETAGLLKGFRSRLPAEHAIQSEVKAFLALQKRGFVRSNAEWKLGSGSDSFILNEAQAFNLSVFGGLSNLGTFGSAAGETAVSAANNGVGGQNLEMTLDRATPPGNRPYPPLPPPPPR